MSLDVKDMFINIPITETIELIKNNRLNNVEYKEQLIEISVVCAKQNYFRFRNRYYVQEEGLPMGSPLSPVMVDIVTIELWSGRYCSSPAMEAKSVTIKLCRTCKMCT